MKRVAIGTLLLLALALPALAAQVKVRTVEDRYPADTLKSLSLEIPVGELKAEPCDGGAVLVQMGVLCDGSAEGKEAAEKIALDSKISGKRMILRVRGFPKSNRWDLSAQLTVKIPRHLDLQCEIGVGSADVRGLERDLSLDIGVGEGRLSGKAASVRKIALETGVGDADLRVPGGNPKPRGFIGKSVSWTGSGKADWSIDIGVGKASAILER